MDETKLNLPSFDKLPGAIAVDLDGTLLNSKAQISERTYMAVIACVESDIPVIIATSRPARTLSRAIGEELIEKCSLIFMNGAFAVAAPPLNGSVRETIEPSLAKEIIDLTIGIEPNIRITIEVEGYWFSTNIPRDPDELWRVNAATPDMQFPLDAALADKPAKIAIGGLNRDLSHVVSAISQRFNTEVSLVLAEANTFLNITSSKATKPNALKQLLDSRQISLADVVAFGDDIPDLDMLSAGGMSIPCLMAMPSDRGLFHKGILESGSGDFAISLENANANSRLFLETAGIKENDIKSLWALTPPQLLEIEKKMIASRLGKGKNPEVTVSAPVIDKEIIPDDSNKLAKQGYSKDIITLIGTNFNEWKLFTMMEPGYDQIDEAGVVSRLGAAMSASDAKTLVAAYRQARAKRGEPATFSEIYTAIFGDYMFRMPGLVLTEAQQANKQAAYNYLFTWKSPAMGGALGACHGLEIGFVFGNYDDMFCGSGPEADKLAECIQDARLAFARTGDPSCESIGKWPVYGSKRMTMIRDKKCHVEMAPYEEERLAWDKTDIFN